jgi:hypothetical protein
MTPTCSKAAMRVLISILLTSSAANAAALPHQALDARAPTPIQNAELAAEAIVAAASAAAADPTNFFEDVSDQLNNRTAFQVFRDFFDRLFGPRDDDNEAPAEVTVTVTASVDVTVPVPAPTTTLEIVLPPIPSTTPIPESEIIFSILPVGDLTSMINATVPTPVFSIGLETGISTPTPSAIEIVAPFPILNATGIEGILPTAASITGEFSVTVPLVTDVPSLVNSTLPEGTGIALPISANATTNSSTAVIIVTQTVTPVPVIVTGTAAAPSASAGLPVIVEPSPLWPNGTYGQPVILPLPLGTVIPLGTGVILGTGTAVVPVETALPLGTGIPLVTGIPLITGTGSLVVPTDLASPLYPNTTVVPILLTGVPEPNVTTSFSTATASFTQIPILVTGVPGVLINFTLPPPAEESVVPPIIATTVAPVETATLAELPVTVTGVPGAVLNISVTIPSGPFANVSATAVAETPIVLTTAAPSAGTGLPVPSLVETTAPFTNTTTTVTVVATPEVIVPSPGTLNFVFPAAGGGNHHA